MYIEWKLRNELATESGERYASYITENRNALDQNWVSDILVLISGNKVNLDRDNQNIEQIINSLESPGFEVPAPSATEGDGQDGTWAEILIILAIPVGIILVRRKKGKSIEKQRKQELHKCPGCGAHADPGTTQMRTKAWLLWGLIGSIPGVLKYEGGCLSFTALGCGTLWKFQLRSLEKKAKKPGLADQLDDYENAVVFDAPLSEILDVRFPWYYFNGGANLVIGGEKFRFSFLQPQNTKWPEDREDSLDPFEIMDSIKEIHNGRQAGKAWRGILLGE